MNEIDPDDLMMMPNRDRVDGVLKWSLRSILASALICVIGLAVDRREVLGDLVWLKPLKFSISIALYIVTFRWLRRRIPRSKLSDLAALVGTLALMVEELLIGLQAARAVQSHFNNTTTFDASIYTAMAIFVGLVFMAGVVLTWVSFRTPTLDPIVRPIASGGSFVMLLGMGAAVVMTSQQGPFPTGIQGAHSVGGLDGGAGLPVVGWSTSHGDLRASHFVGIHALQALVVLGAIGRRRGLSTQRLRQVIRWGSISIGAATVLLAVQALRSIPVTSASTFALVGCCGALLLMGFLWPISRFFEGMPASQDGSG
jgi:hypothetical protein